MSKRYNNYHRHDHYSNVRTPDVISKPQDYISRAKELNHTTYFTTNHGCSGNVLEAYQLCEDNNLKCIYGMEMYYADDRHDKTSRKNYHLIVIGLTKNAYKHINRISSEANKTGFYYHPRIDLSLLLTLPKDEVVITSACLGGRLFKTPNYVEEFVLPLQEYFGDNFMLETQTHNHEDQANWNKGILELSDKYNIPIIHGNDSHYIYPEQSSDRQDFLSGRGMNYGNEDSFLLDYPDYDTILERYRTQGILSEEQAKKSLENTLIFDRVENLNFTKEKKIPNVHQDMDKNKQLQKIVVNNWQEIKKKKDSSTHNQYKEAIAFEMDIIKKTNTADYFLLNEQIIDRAINKYDAVLTRTGRGSAPSFFINHVLGFTDIDRVNAKVPLYPTRFMSIARILESGQLPDIDFNFADVKPVIKASKDILGEDGIYYMVAYGTMQESGAFRNLCRARRVPSSQYNDVAKDLDSYRDDDDWKDLIEESKKFIGVIDSISPSPCSFIILDKPISEEVGLIKVGEEVCASIDGYTADSWGYLKNDYLTVDVWSIISQTFEMIGKSIPSIDELDSMLDDKVWKLYEDGITATINQVDSDFAIELMKKYKAKSIEELSAFVASIRPGFASLLNNFLERKPYSTNVEELDIILEDSFHYLLYQESIMSTLIWCGIPEDQSYDVIKSISKKVFTVKEQQILKNKLIEGFKRQTGNEDGFKEIWQVIEDSVRYAFNASHSYSMAYDSAYGAYLKSHYPLEYYTVVLNHYGNNIDKTSKISNELGYFDIALNGVKYGYSDSNYRFDKETNSIFKGMESIKFMNDKVSTELYNLSQNNTYENFPTLLLDIVSKTSINSRQLKILTSLNFFSEFGENKTLLDYTKYFDILNGKKQFKKSNIYDNNFEIDEITKEKSHLELAQFESLFIENSRETTKTYMDLDTNAILLSIWKRMEDSKLPLRKQIEIEIEYLGYIETKIPTISDSIYFVTEFKIYDKKKPKPYVNLYNIKEGIYLKTRVDSDKDFIEAVFNLHSIIRINKFVTKPKFKIVDHKYAPTGETHELIKNWEVMQ